MGDDDFCCGCLLGLALGYAIGHDGDNNGQTIPHSNLQKNMVNLEQVIEHTKSQDWLLEKIKIYQDTIGPELKAKYGDICKFEPTCSEYSKQAIERYGALKGTMMTAKRIAKCNPISEGGYDPVK